MFFAKGLVLENQPISDINNASITPMFERPETIYLRMLLN